MGILLCQFGLTDKNKLLTATMGMSWLLCEILWDMWQQKLLIMEVWGEKKSLAWIYIFKLGEAV